MTALLGAGWSAPAVDALLGPDTPGVLILASRDPDAKLTYLRTGPVGVPWMPVQRLAVKLPTTTAAGEVVDREGRLLVELRRRQLGPLQHTIPRYVCSRQLGGRPVLVSTVLPGRPMSVSYHQWLHTSRPDLVGSDFAIAGDWLGRFQTATMTTTPSSGWSAAVAATLSSRWGRHRLVDAGLARLAAAEHVLAEHTTASTAVHGDYWFGNLLLDDGRLTGVVDWEAGELEGSPLRDLARFVLSYSLYLDRHTRPGRRVFAHRGLRRQGIAPGIAHGLLGNGWYPRLVRGFLADGLGRLGLPGALWYSVALTGIGEVAAQANDPGFAEEHLTLLASLPLHARRYR